MLRKIFALCFVFSFAISNSVIAQSTQYSGEQTDSIDSVKKTEILILATPHLSNISKNFSPTLLDSLIEVLVNYSPEIIGIEELSGSQIAKMNQLGGIVYKAVVENFAHMQLKYGQIAQENLNISWQKAKAMSDSLLKQIQNSKNIEASIRLKLINYSIASYRLHTAALQWSYLNDKQIKKQTIIRRQTVIVFNNLLHSANENSSIGLRLAHKLGLQRVYPIDDFMARGYYHTFDPQLEKALTDSLAQTVVNANYIRKYKRMLKQGVENGNLLPLYKYMNSTYIEQDKKIQWRNTFLLTDKKVLRKRLAIWQVRNLNIASHIRKASARNPGGRVLITIGASHKSFLDSYLKQLMGVEIVHLSDFIKPNPK